MLPVDIWSRYGAVDLGRPSRNRAPIVFRVETPNNYFLLCFNPCSRCVDNTHPYAAALRRLLHRIFSFVCFCGQFFCPSLCLHPSCCLVLLFCVFLYHPSPISWAYDWSSSFSPRRIECNNAERRNK